MGNIREEVEMFYMRDYVEERIEDRLVEHLSLSDLIFSRNKRVKVNLIFCKHLTMDIIHMDQTFQYVLSLIQQFSGCYICTLYKS